MLLQYELIYSYVNCNLTKNECNKWKVNQTANLCIFLSSLSVQSLATLLGNDSIHTHTGIYISFGLLHASSAASHVCNPFPWLLHLLPLFPVCPSATPSILRTVKRRSQHAVLPEACTINTSSMEARNLKSGLVAPRLSYWKLNTYTFHIIYRYINIYTHMSCLGNGKSAI